MSTKRPQLAKLTRPRLHKAVARERLFALLDEARSHKPAICVVGPPGAGKTTLVASWLDARSLKGIWYQVDPGDADLATFFYYLGEAARSYTRNGQRPLPLLTPEYLHDLEGFSRRFFRELFARLPEGATLVLDNYQEVAPEQPFHQLIASAVDEVPAQMTLVVVSRRDPPDCYARLIANDGVTLVEWEYLKLSLEEARSIALRRNETDVDAIRQLHERSGGWAAGLVLMLENPRKAASNNMAADEPQQQVFSYFASQILERVSEGDRDFLLATADLPWVDPYIGEALTGTKDASRILDDLSRRHLFIHRCAGPTTSYQYHALFQEFLRKQADVSVPQARRTDLRNRAARYLERSGNVAEAFALYQAAQEWDAASHLLLGCAQEMLTHGRFRTLSEWIGALPEEVVHAQPWLAYWHGRALVPLEAVRGRRELQKAYVGFREKSDVVGEIAAAASIIDSIFIENRNFVEMDSWIEILERRLEILASLPSAEMELRVYSSALVAMLYRQPASPLVGICLDRLVSLIELAFDTNGRVAAAISILTYSSASGDFQYGHRVKKLIDPILCKGEVAPAHRFLWHIWLGYFLMMVGEYREAKVNYQAAAELNVDGQFPWSANLQFITGLCSIGCGDYRQALDSFDGIERTAQPARPQDLGYRQMARAWKAVMMNDPQSATRECAEALKFAERIGNLSLSVTWLAPMIWGLGRSASREEFQNFMESTLSRVQGTCFKRPHVELLTMKASLLVRENEYDEARVVLIQALNTAKTLGHEAYFDRLCRFAPGLRTFAARISGQDDFLRALIRKYKWPPPVATVDDWPWPIKVYTLGRFAVLLDDKPLVHGRKVPRKPISLLKAIIALGEHGVPEHKLIDALWPDEEGDAAQHTLALALHRLRRLLGHQEAITVADGVLALNPDFVWTDVRGFEALFEREDAGSEAFVSALLRFYRGSFLAEDADEPWTVSMRERLRAKLLDAVGRTGTVLEESGQYDEAMALYLRGLDADPLAEMFYQGLMRCHMRQGRHAEAISTYRRLRQTLSVVLGVSPSPGTEALVRELRA